MSITLIIAMVASIVLPAGFVLLYPDLVTELVARAYDWLQG